MNDNETEAQRLLRHYGIIVDVLNTARDDQSRNNGSLADLILLKLSVSDGIPILMDKGAAMAIAVAVR